MTRCARGATRRSSPRSHWSERCQVADREHLRRQSVPGYGGAAEAGGERVPHPHQVRLAAPDRADQVAVGVPDPHGRPADLGHLHLEGRLPGGDGGTGIGPLAASARHEPDVGDQHRCGARRHVAAVGEPVAEGPGADRIDAQGQRVGLDRRSGQGDALRKPGRGGVRRAGDVEDDVSVSDLADRGRRDPEPVDLEAFEVAGRRVLEIGIHAGATIVARDRWSGVGTRRSCNERARHPGVRGRPVGEAEIYRTGGAVIPGHGTGALATTAGDRPTRSFSRTAGDVIRGAPVLGRPRTAVLCLTSVA